ncbi:MAG: hypothetical protein KGI06_05755 [Candidatus Micrarchaeota archaeon]|nr:hypothetical protein [Candidatus Micrarchaeota archaeon]
MFMRKALLLLLVLLPMMAIAQLPIQTNLLTGYVGDYGVAPQSGINCTLTLVSPNPRTFNQTFITVAPLSVQSDTNGYFAFTNILWGNYLLSIQGQSYNEIFKIQVQTTTTNTTPLASLGRTFNPSWPNPQTNYYTMPQIDALLSALGTNTGALPLPPQDLRSTNSVAAGLFPQVDATGTNFAWVPGVSSGPYVNYSGGSGTNNNLYNPIIYGKSPFTDALVPYTGPNIPGFEFNVGSPTATDVLDVLTNQIYGRVPFVGTFTGNAALLTNYSTTNLVGIIQTNSVRGAPTSGYVPAIQSDGYLTWVAQTGGGSGVTNNQVLPGIPSTTNGSFTGTFTGNLQQVINVTQPPFNAPADGSADAAAGINAAITYQHTNGGSVYMPPGQYQLQSKLKLYANTPNPGSGSGNIGNVTNSFRLYGDKEHTLLWSTNLTSGNLIEFVSVNGDTNLQGAELDHFKLYGAGYNPANYPNNGGTVSSNYTVSGIFIGQPGVNSGGIGASYARIHDVTVEWVQCGIVFSNVVSMHVDHCNLQMNSTADIIDAHDDTCHINDNFLGITGYPNFATNHYAIWLIGTGAGFDTGNGQLIENNECDGQMLYADHTVALKYVGTDVEDGTGNNSTPYAFVLNGNCQGEFSVIRNNFTWANNTNRFMFHFINPNNQNAIKVTLPSTVSTAVPRKNWFRIDDSNQTVCYATELPEVDIGGSQGQFPDTADLITCLFNTNTWMSVPTSRMLPWRSGSNPTTIGGSQNLGVEVISNTPKSGMIMGWRNTNGTPQTATAAIGILSGDLNLFGYLGLSASDTLSFGYNPNGGGAVGPTAIQFDTASTYGGAPVPALIIDAQQSARFQSNIFTSGITATNGETNLSWTASTVLMADANKGSKSIPNATGWLHNDGAGNVTYSTPSGGTGLPGTNQIAIYGSAANVNGFGSFGTIDLIASNNLGSATFTGGNQTNSGSLSIGGTFAGNANAYFSAQLTAAGITNNGVGATGIVGTDANGKEQKVTLSGLTYDGTTLTSSGGTAYYGPTFTNLQIWDTSTGIYFTNIDGSSLLWHDGTLTADTITTSNFNVTGNFYTGKTNVFILGTDSNSQIVTNGLTAGANITLSYAQNASGGTNVTIASTAGGSAVVFTNATVAYGDLHQTNGFGAFVGLDIVISNNLGSAVFVGGNQTNTGTLKALAFVGSGYLTNLTTFGSTNYGDKYETNALVVNSGGVTTSNNLGSVFSTGGNTTNTGTIKAAGFVGTGTSTLTNLDVYTPKNALLMDSSFHQVYDLSATPILAEDWSLHALYDNSGVLSLSYGARYLYDSAGSQIGSWNSGFLFQGDKYNTNAVSIASAGTTISNALGSAFFYGGNQTNTGVITATGFYGNGGGLTNLNAGVLTGYVHTVTYDLSSAWPGDTLPATWSTNTPGPYSTNLQSAGPSFKAYAISVSGTNNLLLQCDVPEYYGGGAVTAAVCVVSGTNANITGAHDITNVFALSGAVYGTALGTAQVMTNNLALGTGTISTNWAWPNGITIAGTVTKSQPVIFQLQSWGGSPYWTSTNNEWAISLKVTWPLTNAQYNTISVP